MTQNTPTLARNRGEHHHAESTRNGKYFTPRVDIVETDTELLLYADMPGIRPEDVDLRYENGELVLHGKFQAEHAKGHMVFGEYEAGDFYRVFQVHETIDASKIEGECKNGVLTVHLPKQEAAKPKQVAIRTA